MSQFEYNQDFYNTNEAYFKSLEQKTQTPLWFKDFYDAILSETSPSSEILDCGCGTGITTAFLHQSRPKIKGIDFSDRFIEEAKKTGQLLPANGSNRFKIS